MDFVTLNNGVKMPQLGYGVYQTAPEATEQAVRDALSIGYRLIDTAASYGNEEGNGKVFTQPVLLEIAAKYGKTTGQVMLRWLLQRGIAVIPKSVHKARMQENFDVFDFAFDDSDMEKIKALDTKKSTIYDEMDPKVAMFIATRKIHD